MNPAAPRYTVEITPRRDARGRFRKQEIIMHRVEPWLDKGKRSRNPDWKTAPFSCFANEEKEK
jgi:hypothetical protein